MKYSIKRNDVLMMQLSLTLAIVLLVGAGCAHTIRLRVVDAKTGEPLDGVSTVWHERRYNLLTKQEHEIGPTNLPVSLEDGAIFIRGVHKDWANNLIFSRSGYTTLYANYDDARLWMTERIHPVTNGSFILEKPVAEAISSNGWFLIKMSK